MSDYAAEAGNAGVQLGGAIVMKAMSAITALINKIFEMWKNAPERALEKEELKALKTENEKRAYAEKIEGKTGYVKHEDLKKAGVPLTSTGVTLNKAEFQDLAAHCKREGIAVSAVADSREYALNARKMYVVHCKQEDLRGIARIVDTMNDEQRIAGIDKRIDEITREADGRLTDQDRVDIGELQRQREEIRHGNTRRHNDEQARLAFDRSRHESGVALDAQPPEEMTLGKALDHYEGWRIDVNQEYYVADASDPERHIKCNAYMDEYNGKPYVKTDYEVYDGKSAQPAYVTNDGQFEGRPKHYWPDEKVRMKEKGGFSDTGTYLKFNSREGYESFLADYRAQNQQELRGIDHSPGTDYAATIDRLESELGEKGFKLENGEAVHLQSGEKVWEGLRRTDGGEGIPEKEKWSMIEANAIAMQTGNYKELQRLDAEMGIAKAETLMEKDGTPAHAAAAARHTDLEAQHQAALKRADGLIDERKRINAIQAEQNTRVLPADRQPQGGSRLAESLPRDTRSGGRNLKEYSGKIDGMRQAEKSVSRGKELAAAASRAKPPDIVR